MYKQFVMAIAVFFSLQLLSQGKQMMLEIKKTTLLTCIEWFPPGYFVACDCAYSISEQLIRPYSGAEQFLEKNVAFNFY
jgi:hypothetical protein